MLDRFNEAYNTDEESWSKKEARLVYTYEMANETERALMNDIFITLCGYSFETLLKEK